MNSMTTDQRLLIHIAWVEGGAFLPAQRASARRPSPTPSNWRASRCGMASVKRWPVRSASSNLRRKIAPRASHPHHLYKAVGALLSMTLTSEPESGLSRQVLRQLL